MKKKFKYIRYKLETFLAFFIYYFFYFLVPIKIASKIGYFLGRYILAYLPIKRKKEIIKNIKLSLPKENALKIYKESWGVFGSTLLELPKLDTILYNPNKYLNLINNSSLDFSKEDNFAFFSCHSGNWELAALVFQLLKKHTFITYKAPNNPYVEDLILKIRAQKKENIFFKVVKINKKNIISIYSSLKRNKMSICSYSDQKVKEGLKLKFFGRDAYTLNLLPTIALKNNIPLVPIRVIRKPNCQFDLIIEKPLEITRSNNIEKDIFNLSQKMNDTIEKWVKELPSQWLWLHKRW